MTDRAITPTDEAAGAARELAAPLGDHAAAPARSVLVVEDDPIFRELLVLALRTRGLEARGAANGAVALQALSEARPDAIVLDLLMPVMDGLTFLRALREKGQAVPVIVLTALEERSHVVDALVAGATEVLTKPASLEDLLKKLEALR